MEENRPLAKMVNCNGCENKNICKYTERFEAINVCVYPDLPITYSIACKNYREDKRKRNDETFLNFFSKSQYTGGI